MIWPPGQRCWPDRLDKLRQPAPTGMVWPAASHNQCRTTSHVRYGKANKRPPSRRFSVNGGATVLKGTFGPSEARQVRYPARSLGAAQVGEGRDWHGVGSLSVILRASRATGNPPSARLENKRGTIFFILLRFLTLLHSLVFAARPAARCAGVSWCRGTTLTRRPKAESMDVGDEDFRGRIRGTTGVGGAAAAPGRAFFRILCTGTRYVNCPCARKAQGRRKGCWSDLGNLS